MSDHNLAWPPCNHLPQGIDHQRGRLGPIKRPADDLARLNVEDHRQIRHIASQRGRGGVTDDELTRFRHLKVTLHMVLNAVRAMIGYRGAPAAPPGLALNPQFFHATIVATTTDLRIPQLHAYRQAVDAIRATMLGVQRP